jgi:hypothetical protein
MMVAAMNPQSGHLVEARIVRFVLVDFDAAYHSYRHTAMFPSRLPRGPLGSRITESTIA